MDLSGLGTAGALVITAFASLMGVWFKRSFDRRTADEAAKKSERERDDAARGDVYRQMSETLEANRAEMRAMQADLGRLRTESEDLWSRMTAMRRAVDAYEAHIAAWNRWADAGAQGPRPTPLQGIVP